MIDLSELTFDPDFCTTFTVEKHSITWEKGIATPTSSSIKVTGIVAPASPKDVEMLELTDRKHGVKTFYTNETELEVSDTQRISDIIIWKGNRYKLLHVFDYSANGYWKAIGDLMGGVASG